MSSDSTILCSNCSEQVPIQYVVCPFCGWSLIKAQKERITKKVPIAESLSRIKRLIIGNPLIDPPEVMDEIATNWDRKGPIFVIFLICFAFSLKIGAHLPKIQSEPIDLIFFILLAFIVFPLVFGIIYTVFGYFFVYLLSLIIHMICLLLGGKGARTETFSILGYALTPLFIVELLIAILFYLFLPVLPISEYLVVTGESLAQTVAFLGAALTIVQIFELLVIPTLIYSAYLTGLGIEKVHRLGKTEAYGVSGVLGGLIIIIFVLGVAISA